MPTYTVHEPLPRKHESVTAPERFVFVRDGFYFWAFVLAPLWLLWRRLWLAFFIYIIFNVAVGIGLALAGAPFVLQTAVASSIALAVGLEAATIWRWTLSRRRWKMLGFVVGEDQEISERRFFAEWAKRGAQSASAPPAAEPRYAAPIWRGKPSVSDVIGLFPEPGVPR